MTAALSSRPGSNASGLAGVDGLPSAGLAFVGVEHDGNKNCVVEEVDVVARLVQRLTAPHSSWCNARRKRSADRRLGDILIVAPYNAQVTRLTDRLASTGARVGTVDKFQGQEAPVVIYSMATSRPEDAPRGMEFLYSLNRLNVATSRARCLAILVAITAPVRAGVSKPETDAVGERTLSIPGARHYFTFAVLMRSSFGNVRSRYEFPSVWMNC